MDGSHQESVDARKLLPEVDSEPNKGTDCDEIGIYDQNLTQPRHAESDKADVIDMQECTTDADMCTGSHNGDYGTFSSNWTSGLDGHEGADKFYSREDIVNVTDNNNCSVEKETCPNENGKLEVSHIGTSSQDNGFFHLDIVPDTSHDRLQCSEYNDTETPVGIEEVRDESVFVVTENNRVTPLDGNNDKVNNNNNEPGKYVGINNLFVGGLNTGPKKRSDNDQVKGRDNFGDLQVGKPCHTFHTDKVNSSFLGTGDRIDLCEDTAGGSMAIDIIDTGDDTSKNREHVPLANAEEGQSPYGQMALYEEDLSERGKLSQILARISNYQAGIAPDPNDLENSAKKPQSAKLGLLMGVYLPCIQNIFGVILFIRLAWLVGNAGLVESFFIVVICCLTTMLTAISMSAIATNGVVPGGGSYFMISRALGPEFGGAVGVLFYLGTSVASSMYIIGAVEILVQYIAPGISIFGDITIPENAFNNYRVFGTCLLILLIACVFVGVRFVSKFAPISLFCVILSILSIYIGIFAASPSRSVSTCLLGNRLLARDSIMRDGVFRCDKNDPGPIYQAYCGGENGTLDNCDPYFMANNVTEVPGIPGLASGIVKENIVNHYSEEGMIPGGSDIPADRSRGEIMADITASFTILVAIFFPSVTGIMAGSNRSGDLADAQKSIPVGTICAIATTSVVYLSCVFFFAGTITGELMRDKFGESIGGGLVVANLAWPHPYVILVGSLLSTVGAGLQSLTGAPRLLQAIAQDGVVPFLNVFSVTTKKGEPMRAILLTAAISEIGILIASLDSVTPIITMFFLMCYGFVNMACALQTLLRTPNWRPRFRFYHWTLSLLGMSLCIALMFISSWYYALMAIALAICIYKYIEYKGAEKEWGDGIRGLAMSAARYALLNLEQGPPHTKNWRPQLLVLMKLDSNFKPRFTRMVTFAGQLKAGKGLTMLASVLQGHHKERFADAQAAKQMMNKVVEETGVKAFADVLVAKSVTDGLCDIIQTAGLGGLKHNTVVMGWPYGWRHSPDVRSYRVFLDTVKNVIYCQHCLLVIKGAEMFPESSQKLSGTIDVWWIVHEGGLLMLLPFLLRQHKTWKNCKLRIFTVAQLEDNSIQMKKDLEHYLYQLRIEAEVAVVEMSEGDISAYTYERTLMMEQRTEMLKEMRIKERKEAQTIMDKAHTPTHRNIIPTIKLDAVPEEPDMDSPVIVEDKLEEPVSVSDINQFTFSPQNYSTSSVSKDFISIKPSDKNVRRMHTAVRLNEAIVDKSHNAQLVILNMPAPPKVEAGEENYMEYLEVLTEGLDRVLMVRGSGREVITIYS